MSIDNQANSETLAGLKKIIRRDLGLDEVEEITDEMPLAGGDLDLDSLDILMLVTSVEKQFKVKISSQSMGREAFKTVATLAAYIDQTVAESNGQEIGSSVAVDMQSVLDHLPHQPPFRFVSEVVALEPGVRVEGLWKLSGEESFFKGHFPGHPLVPGVLLSEALAQLSGLLLASTQDGPREHRLAQVNMNYRASVMPPAEVRLISKPSRSLGSLEVFEVSAEHKGQVAAEGTITLAAAPVTIPE